MAVGTHFPVTWVSPPLPPVIPTVPGLGLSSSLWTGWVRRLPTMPVVSPACRPGSHRRLPSNQPERHVSTLKGSPFTQRSAWGLRWCLLTTWHQCCRSRDDTLYSKVRGSPLRNRGWGRQRATNHIEKKGNSPSHLEGKWARTVSLSLLRMILLL